MPSAVGDRGLTAWERVLLPAATLWVVIGFMRTTTHYADSGSLPDDHPFLKQGLWLLCGYPRVYACCVLAYLIARARPQESILGPSVLDPGAPQPV